MLQQSHKTMFLHITT